MLNIGTKYDRDSVQGSRSRCGGCTAWSGYVWQQVLQFHPKPPQPLSGGGGGGGGACPHTLHASCNSTAPISFKTGSQTNRKLLPTGLQLEYVCSLGPGSMCNSYNVIHVLTFWCNYICNAPPKGLTVRNH